MVALLVLQMFVGFIASTNVGQHFFPAGSLLFTLMPLGFLVLASPVSAARFETLLLWAAVLSPAISALCLRTPHSWLIKSVGRSPLPKARRVQLWARMIKFMPMGGLLIPFLIYLRHAHATSVSRAATFRIQSST
jgi:hypothetical protein